jgi:lysine-specific demethylase 8
MALEVDRVAQLSVRDFRRNYLEAERPVIISRGASHWEAARRWSPDYLKERFGQHPIKARFLPHGRSSVIDGTERPEKPRTLGQFVDTMRSQPGDGLWYLTQLPIASLPTDLLQELGTLDYYSRGMQALTGHTPYFWMGSSGSKTGLHYDLLHNFNIQVTGRKAWKLYPRSEQNLLYFGQGDYPHHSVVNIFDDDLAKYPLIAQASPHEFVLEAGDVLFFPAGWAHCVYSLEESISLNFFSLWFRIPDLGIVLREAPSWAYKKMVFKTRALRERVRH